MFITSLSTACSEKSLQIHEREYTKSHGAHVPRILPMEQLNDGAAPSLLVFRSTIESPWKLSHVAVALQKQTTDLEQRFHHSKFE
jgi:hypothetical protein